MDLENLKAAKENLVDIRQKKMEGVLLRSRAKWVGEGEKRTKYFCGLEKRNFVSKQMNNITAKDGSFLTQTNTILQETKHFYGSLHVNRKTEDYKIEQLIKEYPKIAEEEAENLEGKITVEEATCTKENEEWKKPRL